MLIRCFLALCLLPVTLVASEPLTTYILAGQSNMLGRASTADLEESLRLPQERALVFTQGKWVALKLGKQFGPEVAFARAMTADGRTIGLIKVAKGGTSLGTHWKAGEGEWYVKLLEQIAAARATRSIKLAGLLWAQGEADSKDAAEAKLYGERLTAFVQRLRADLSTPDLPVIALRVNPPFPHAEAVRNAIEKPNLLHYTWIDGDDVAKADDKLHYNAAGQLVLGRRFADALVALIKAK